MQYLNIQSYIQNRTYTALCPPAIVSNKGYSNVGSGGCATAFQTHVPKLATQKVKNIEECYTLCKARDTCKYFEYETLHHDSKGDYCNMHYLSEINRGNGFDGSKCYKMENDGK